jgi:Cyclin, N-terminal domain
MEEIICPRVKDFVFATDNGFTNSQIIDMEAEISRVRNLYTSLSIIGNGVPSLPCNIKLLVSVFYG